VQTRLTCALAGALAAAWLAAAPVPAATASAPCAAPGYSYAGVTGKRGLFGVAGVLTALETPVVESGHVAAWVGVGGLYEGPGGTGEWLQVGLNSLPGTGNRLYYEYAAPGVAPAYVEVDGDVAAGRAVSVAVLEAAGRPDTWRVWEDGRPVSGPIVLPDSHEHLTAVATAENWDGGTKTPGCNSFSYRFDRLRVATAAGGVWRRLAAQSTLRDPGRRVTQSSSSGFVVSAGVGGGTADLDTPSP